MDHKVFIAKLRKMRALIAKGWTQGSTAKNAKGAPVASNNPRAASWCLMGAAMRVGLPRWGLYSLKGEAMSSVSWNDVPRRTKAEVLACIDNSIAALQ